MESHRNCWRRTLQGDQCGRVEDLELDLVRLFGVPSFDVLRDPGDIDISPAGIRDQVEAVRRIIGWKMSSCCFALAGKGKRAQATNLSSPQRVVVKDPALLVQQDAQSRSERPVSFGAGHRQIRERSRQQVREEGERSRAGESVRTATCQRVLDLGLRWAWEGKLTSTGPCVLRRRGRKISGLGGVPQLRRMRTAFVSSVHRHLYSVIAPLTWTAGDLGLVSAFVPERHFPPGEFDHVASVRAVECIQGGLLDLFS